jgi:hypothetical protein
MNKFFALILSLPASNPTERMRIWRLLKTTGAAILRDGVYLLPSQKQYKVAFDLVAEQVLSASGNAHVVTIEVPISEDFKSLFDRTSDYAQLVEKTSTLTKKLKPKLLLIQIKEARKLRKQYEALVQIDFYPGEASHQASRMLDELESAIITLQSPDEPQAISRKLPKLNLKNYQGKKWATRSGLWVDRLASAWLIRKYIDPKASFIWLKTTRDCPKSAFGFDFDGATFTHTDSLVTFEVIAQSFGIDDDVIKRLGSLIHALDVGGIQPLEAQGIESIMTGLKISSKSDDELLEKASAVFDALISAFMKEGSK